VTTVAEDPQLDLMGDEGVGVTAETKLDRCQCDLSHETLDGRCANTLPEGHHVTRRYCDGCKRGGALHSRTERDKPPTVKFEVKPPRATNAKDATKVKVAGAATAWIGLAAVAIEAAGDKVCADALKASAPSIAAQLAELSEYHPGIVKVLAPVEASGEVAVWIALVIAVSPIILTVLAHHELIPASWAERIAVGVQMGSVVTTPPE